MIKFDKESMTVSGDTIVIASEICTFLEFLQTNLEMDIPTLIEEMEKGSIEDSEEIIKLMTGINLLMTPDSKDTK